MNKIILQYKLALHLIDNYDYELLNLFDENIDSIKNDVWLTSRKEKYSLIRITYSNNELNEEYLENINNTIGKMINNKQKVLTICLFKNEFEPKENYLYVTDEYISNSNTKFKDLRLFLQNDEWTVNDLRNELYLKGQRKQKKYITTYSVMGICLVLFLLVNIFSKVFINSITSSIIFLAYYRPFIMAKDYIRLFTASFIHIDMFHFFVNMYSLYSLSKICEEIFGSIETLMILLFSSLFGNIMSYIFTTTSIIVGISGGIYGLFSAILVYYIYSGIIKRKGVFNSLITTVSINIVINFLPFIAVYAHIGGAFMGVLLGMLYIKNIDYSNFKINLTISIILIFIISLFKISTIDKLKVGNLYGKTDEYVLNVYKESNLSFYSEFIENNLLKIYEVNVER